MRRLIILFVAATLGFAFIVPAHAEDLVRVSPADIELINFIEDSQSWVSVGVDEQGRDWVLANTSLVPEPVGETGLYATSLKTATAIKAVSELSDFSIFPNFMVSLDEPIVVQNAMTPADVLGVDPVIKIAANEVHLDGNTGENVAVAIIDTGIDPDHPYFKDEQGNSRIVAEACFVGIGQAPADATNNFPCLNNETEQIGIGSSDITNHVTSNSPENSLDQASAFTSSYEMGPADWASILDHGTHVAGLATGSSNALTEIPDSVPGGIAPDADIISVRVFGYNAGWIWNDTYNFWIWSTGSAYYLDIIAAVDWVTQTSSTHNTAALNLSLGGGNYPAACDDSYTYAASLFVNARNAGVAPMVASGNDSYDNAVAWPSCISSAISVGASTGADELAYFSNSGVVLDIAAPGVDVRSAIPITNNDYSETAYQQKDGTSMATPVAAGAIALMRAARPDVTVDQIEAALKTTGFRIDDAIIKNIPRINVDLAITELGLAPVAQTISVTGGTKLVVNETLDVAASSTSGLTVRATTTSSRSVCTFTSTTESTITNIKVTAIGSGTCRLRFNQVGDSSYLAATEVIHEIQITSLIQQTISVTGETELAMYETVDIAASASSALLVTVASVTSSGICTFTSTTEGTVTIAKVTATGAGTCQLRFNQAGGTGYLPAGQVIHEIEITKLEQVILVEGVYASTVGSSIELTAGSDSGLNVSYSLENSSNICNANSSYANGIRTVTLNFTKAGACIVQFTQAGDDVYESAALVSREITVTRNSQNLTISMPNSITVGNSIRAIATASFGLVTMETTTSSVCSVSGLEITALRVGLCELTFSTPESSSHNSTSTTRTVSVSAPVVISVPSINSVRMLKPKIASKSVSLLWNAPSNVAASGLAKYIVKYRISYPGKKISSWITKTTTSRSLKVTIKSSKFRLEYSVTAVAPKSKSKAVAGNVKKY